MRSRLYKKILFVFGVTVFLLFLHQIKFESFCNEQLEMLFNVKYCSQSMLSDPGVEQIGCLALDYSQFFLFGTVSPYHQRIRVYLLNEVDKRCSTKRKIHKLLRHNENILKDLNLFCYFPDGNHSKAIQFTSTPSSWKFNHKKKHNCDNENIALLKCSHPNGSTLFNIQKENEKKFIQLRKKVKSRNVLVGSIPILPNFEIPKTAMYLDQDVDNGSFGICACPMKRYPSQYALLSWIHYHLAQGCVLISLNTCKIPKHVPTPSWLIPFIDNGSVVIQPVCQEDTNDNRETLFIYSANLCKDRMENVAAWVAVIDPDEYLFLVHQNETVQQHLAATYDPMKIPALLLQNQFLGPCPWKDNQASILTSQPNGKGENHTIVRNLPSPFEVFPLVYPPSPVAHLSKVIYSTRYRSSRLSIAGIHQPMSSEYILHSPANQFVFRHFMCILSNRTRVYDG